MIDPKERHVLQWHITHRCNLHCVHCYQKDRERQTEYSALESTLEKYERYLELIKLPGQINLTGGEPLMHPDFFRLAERIREKGRLLSVLTNGTLIDGETAKRLSKLRPLFVQVSLDGTEEAHDAIRGKGAFAAALAGIDRLKEQGVKVLVSFTAQKGNTDQLRALAGICREHRVDKLWWDRVVTNGPEETEKLALTTKEFLGLVGEGTRLKNEGYPIDNGRAMQFLFDGSCGGYRCAAGFDLLIILADGSMMPCRRLPFITGHIDDGEIAETLAKDPVMRKLRLARTPERCVSCPDLLRCFGGAKCVTYAQTGDWSRPDVNCPRCK